MPDRLGQLAPTVRAISRKPIFQAVRQLRGGQGYTMDEVRLLDKAIDEAFGVITVITPTTVILKPKALAKPMGFFDYLRGTNILGPTLTQPEVEGCNALLAAMGSAFWGPGWTAYGLATTYHETAGTMQPLKEYGRGKGKAYGKPGKYGQPQYGRGYVQLTWDRNYEKADSALGLAGRLVANFDLALDPAIAAAILVRGMQEGWFTGKKLSDFMAIEQAGSKEDFRRSRVIINGRDRDTLIAGYAVSFQQALKEGEWS